MTDQSVLFLTELLAHLEILINEQKNDTKLIEELKKEIQIGYDILGAIKMGEARYYLKATFANPESAQKAADDLNHLLREEAYDYWQTNRTKLSPEEFWPTFKSRFPLHTEILKEQELLDKDCNNKLAGQISFVDFDVSEPTVENCVVKYDAEVWHMADWDGLARFMEQRGAEKAAWISDEYADIYDTL